VKLAWATALCLAAVACEGTVTVRSTFPSQATPAGAELPPPLPIAPQPDVELADPHVAVVSGQRVPFDGLVEGLEWPALARAVGPRKAGDVVTIQASRDVPVQDVLRAAWTARVADVHLQSKDGSGAMHAVELRAKREGASSAAATCHLAVFRRDDGSLRVAAPGGPREIGGDRPAETLARSLDEERRKCPIKYVAFGAESDAAAWGPVFDVLVAVDRARSAGDARYVLGQAMHAK
jgi:hypothetical protein